jgi:N-methylhydantoinase B
LRAQIGAINLAIERVHALLRKYGPDTVKAVIKRMMNDTEQRLRARLRELPDGEWHAVAYQEGAREGDRGLYKIVCRMIKKDAQLTFDFRGTDRQVEGLIHCTHSTLYASVLIAVLQVLCGDIPWSAGGVLRCFDIVSEEGTLNNVVFPGGVSKGSVASSWATMNACLECLTKMVAGSPEQRKGGIAVCVGTWSLACLSGIDQYQRPFVTMLMDPMAGGLGARTDSDGVDTGGSITIVMGRMPDVEMGEFMEPILYLWRREEIDSGGPGRFRGGLGASLCVVPHDTDTRINLVLSGSGKAVSMNNGINGGYPGNTQSDITVRGSNIRQLFAAGIIPSQIREIAGEIVYEPPEIETFLDPNDVYFLLWQAGGGYCDPILREPQRVRHDVTEFKVSPAAARDIYGVVFRGADFEIDEIETERLRQQIRARRRQLARIPKAVFSANTPASGRAGVSVNDNIAESAVNGDRRVFCRHCAYQICRASDSLLDALAIVEGEPAEAGPQIFSEGWRFIDTKVVFRQYCCPGCFTAFSSQVVPTDHPVMSDHAEVA